MKRLHKLGHSEHLSTYNRSRDVFVNDYDVFRQFAFAVDFKPTTIFFGVETFIYFNEMSWSERNIKIRL